MTRTNNPRVFVSSVVEGFEEVREAARTGIVAAGGEPVMVNEDLPSQHISSRNACLDGVSSADIMLCIIGARGGWRAPSGLLVVEEEVNHARSRKLPILLFLEECDRDDGARELERRLSDYIHGLFRRTFRTTEELASGRVNRPGYEDY